MDLEAAAAVGDNSCRPFCSCCIEEFYVPDSIESFFGMLKKKSKALEPFQAP